jgi:hypothetical protein
MNKLYNNISGTGWFLFILLIIPFVLLLMAEPSFDDSEPKLPEWIAMGWAVLLLFSTLLIIVGSMLNKYNINKQTNKKY